MNALALRSGLFFGCFWTHPTQAEILIRDRELLRRLAETGRGNVARLLLPQFRLRMREFKEGGRAV